MSETLTQTTEERRYQWLNNLRQAYEFLRDNPEAINIYSGLQVDVFTSGAEEMADLARAIGGRWDKDGNDSYFYLVKQFGTHRVHLTASRASVCERVEVGEETVTIPDPDAPKVTVTRPTYAWKCADSVLALAEPRPSEVVPADDEIDPF